MKFTVTIEITTMHTSKYSLVYSNLLLVPYRFTGGDFRFTLRPSVCQSVCLSVSPSVHKTGSRDNLKSTENVFMKLDIWIDGSMEIMHIFFFSSYVENSGCYGNK
jgi:hypothetical protein